ncbi:universal stress protein [Rhodopila sp.]|jgi:nucleotide-binding universal stress UspA family protein|uniref:universal stress protein n=1 Tax=Rhodopila sp. TaxID=2480087 RepID=UPI002B532ECB|nr:universal stress protein [Rhodopila sp.]HVZ09419.1 universal stress protein [Rhodopila sp.]
MSLKDILIHLDADPRSAVRLEAAAGLAARHGAFLTGVFVIDIPSTDYFYGAGFPMAGLGPDQLIDTLTAEARAAAEPVEAQFREVLRKANLQGEWRLVEGHTHAVLSTEARYADVVVVGQPDDPRRSDTRGRLIVETVLMTSGRPVLVVPFAGKVEPVTDHVLVAWNASREATRAVHDAMPLLRTAKQITILSINPRAPIDEDEAPHTDLATHLGRHGVRSDTSHTVAEDIPDGEALLSYASDIGATMIVAGGYGHSRARELVFGGVTRTLLAEMTVPVFFSH